MKKDGLQSTNSTWTTKRKHIRYKADSNLVARMEWGARIDAKAFRPQHIGLVLEEAYGGCGLAMGNDSRIQVGDRVRIEVGKLKPMFAEVVWKNDVDHQLMKIGIKFLE